ncbi:MAG: radical SAM protein [Candidatus Saganbacteria bacterium]|nr:radical SAM protein [Candidatus Saganbacteria bacterium]
MKELDFDDFSKGLDEKLNKSLPLNGQIELTYRCGFNCIHCYCKAYNRPENKEKELSFEQWKGVLDQIHAAGGLYLTLTGGDPLLHSDFFKIYDYAIDKGFLVSIFTNGFILDDEHIQHFLEKRPFNIEITLNGITPQTYEAITTVPDSFKRVMETIRKIKESGLPLVLKTNGLKENRDEILAIKKFIYDLLGKGKYKFDSFICAGMDHSLEPTKHRLEPEEIFEIESTDPDMQAHRNEQMKHDHSLWRSKDFLYHCNSWMKGYFINPYGFLQFCHLSTKYSTDLTKESFKKGFYEEFPKLLAEKYKTNSKCVTCKDKDLCYHCPARAFVEVGDEEAPVEYFCKLARNKVEQREELKGKAI